jgi:nitrate reductase cytochrome c-type subunit
MKSKIGLFLTILTFIFAASCTKEGPQGPAGEDGINGIDGENGTAGCVQCHTSDEDMQVKAHEWEVSGHVTGGHMTGYYASRDGCADCHSSQGFQTVVETGIWDNPAPDRPLPANCYTCHKIHESYTSEDWAFRVGDEIPLLSSGMSTNQTTANTCVQCHQSRIASPELDISGNEMVSITSSRYGPHHGPQGNMMAGVSNTGAYELMGSMNYADSDHATDPNTNCVSCHMASGAGSSGDFSLGGHSNNVATGSWDDESRVVNANGCIECHDQYSDNAGITGFVAERRALNLASLDELKQALMDLGYINESNSVNASSSNPLQVTTEHAAAIYNYKFLIEDQSAMIHNPKYSKALLNNSLEALNN